MAMRYTEQIQVKFHLQQRVFNYSLLIYDFLCTDHADTKKTGIIQPVLLNNS